METALIQSGTAQLLKQSARFAERRQEVLAGNVANIDTPGYRMRDLPADRFQAALKAAIGQMSATAAPPTAAPLALGAPVGLGTVASAEPLFPADLFRAVDAEPAGSVTFQDENNRSVEHQMLELNKNSLMQQMAVDLLNAQYSQLQMAISERVA